MAENGKQVTLTIIGESITPYQVEVRVNGALKKSLAFASRKDAERAQTEELASDA